MMGFAGGCRAKVPTASRQRDHELGPALATGFEAFLLARRSLLRHLAGDLRRSAACRAPAAPGRQCLGRQERRVGVRTAVRRAPGAYRRARRAGSRLPRTSERAPRLASRGRVCLLNELSVPRSGAVSENAPNRLHGSSALGAYSSRYEGSSLRRRGCHRCDRRAQGHRRSQRAGTRGCPGRHRAWRWVRGRPDSRRGGESVASSKHARWPAARVRAAEQSRAAGVRGPIVGSERR